MDALDSAHLIVALTMTGTALIFAFHDGSTPSTRALSLCLLCTGAAVFIGEGTLPVSAGRALAGTFFECTAILAGLEWGRRVGRSAQGRARRAANGLFIAAQILALVYGGLAVGYVLLLPESALAPGDGIVAARAVAVAVGAPLLGAAMLLAAIAITMLRFSRIDRAEMARLRALFWAGPFLLAGVAVADPLVPLTLTIGLLIFLAGSVGYFTIQSGRGAFMKQFLSPDVAKLVQTQGQDAVLRRARRPLSIVVCDLRGFTAFAAEHDSGQVTAVLEQFYGCVGAIAARYGGTVKDHAGDGILILVGAPVALEDHPLRAAKLALDLVREGRELVSRIAPGVGLGVGVASGDTTVGAIRGAGRLEYVAVGTAVNLAARLCQQAGDGEVLVTEAAAEAARDSKLALTPRPIEALRGIAQPGAVYALG